MGIGNIANTGMDAAMSNMEVISNNIANSNTTGFKKSYANFSDIFPSGNGASGVQAGLGVSLNNIMQDFSTGGYQTTGLATDLSINSNGFFIMRDSTSGQVSYTRAGRFTEDENGFLTVGNDRLQGFPAQNGVVPPGSSTQDLQISNAPLPAKASTTVNLALNLDASQVAPTGAFDPTDNTTFNYTSTANVIDSLGNSYPITLYYIKTADNNWTVNAQLAGSSIGTGALVFSNETGQLTSSSGLNALSFTPTSGAAGPQEFALNLTGSTQFAQASAVTQQPNTNGYGAGSPSSFNIDKNGNVIVTYSNGLTQLAGQVALAEFESVNGLQNIGNMSWLASTSSGNAVVSQANSTGNFAPGTYELSNVDLTQEMVNLIGAQHSFQANAQVEQTYNEIMQTVIQL